jgi:ubiquinone/menaquinone biosynthesis C-methylase UbiE
MMAIANDKWSEWLLHRRFGGDPAAAERGLAMLHRVRDGVLDEAQLPEGSVLLDVGCGDGLMGFGALERVGSSGHVVFADISRPLLEYCRQIAVDIGVLELCRFVVAPADDLAPIDDASVDVVTTRSVLIYVKNKERAFAEFFRVLKPGGGISLWEPINRFGLAFDEDETMFNLDAPEIAELARRLAQHYRRLQPPDTDPMLNFDERDLFRLADHAGFGSVHVTAHLLSVPSPPASWNQFVNSAGNPNIPTVLEAMLEIFDDEERARFERVGRPLVEAGGRRYRTATASVVATKAGG